jgi:hypothetical protein
MKDILTPLKWSQKMCTAITDHFDLDCKLSSFDDYKEVAEVLEPITF